MLSLQKRSNWVNVFLGSQLSMQVRCCRALRSHEGRWREYGNSTDILQEQCDRHYQSLGHHEQTRMQNSETVRGYDREACCVWQLVFSSSCTVYGNPKEVPITEDHPRSSISVYGRTKLLNEDIMMDLATADKEWRIILLRYDVPVCSHQFCTG